MTTREFSVYWIGGQAPHQPLQTTYIRVGEGDLIHLEEPLDCTHDLLNPCLQALESLLAAYRVRHAQCTSSEGLPGKYMLMSMVDEYAGLGNQFPGIITGAASYTDKIMRLKHKPCSGKYLQKHRELVFGGPRHLITRIQHDAVAQLLQFDVSPNNDYMSTGLNF